MTQENVKSFPSHMGPYGSADFRFCSARLDTGLCCETMDMGLVHRTGCLFTLQSSLVLVPIHSGMARLSLPGYTGWHKA